MSKNEKGVQGFVSANVKMLELKPVLFFRTELEFSRGEVGFSTVYNAVADNHTQTVVVNNPKEAVFHVIQDGLESRLKELFTGLFNTQLTLSNFDLEEALRLGLNDTVMNCYIGVLKPDDANTIRVNSSFRLGEYYDFLVLKEGMKLTPNSFANLLVPELMRNLTELVDKITKLVTE